MIQNTKHNRAGDERGGKDPSQIGSRAAEISEILKGLTEPAATGRYRALAALIADAALAADETALQQAQDGLQRLHAAQLATNSSGQAEDRGRVLALLDSVDWTLRRLARRAAVSPQSHAARCLLKLSDYPGLYSGQLSDAVGIDDTQMSRLGRRLLAQGLVRNRRLGKNVSWELTANGWAAAQALEQPGDRESPSDQQPTHAPAASPPAKPATRPRRSTAGRSGSSPSRGQSRDNA